MARKISRRSWLSSCSLLASGVWLGTSSRPLFGDSPNEKLNVACIGIGGQGGGNVNAMSGQNLVALCDVDEVRGGSSFAKYPQAKRYADFRKMFDALDKQIDAVVVSTPDHTHFHPTLWALQRGKHVYVEKPLAHDVWQARRITDLAREKKVATQLGAQRHAIPNMARVVELIRAKVIGEVTEVHSWIGSGRGMPKDPEFPETPATLNWDLWLGPARERRYSPGFAPYNWRFWWDYGTGETGNWGCHILDIPFWALNLKYPTKVSATGPAVHAEKTPTSLTARFEFPADEHRGPVTLYWGQTQSPAILKEKGIDGKGVNTVFVGTKGILACGFSDRKLYPVEQFKGFQPPPPSIPASPGFHREWLDACRGGKPATCQFDYSGPLTETVLLGNVAFRAGGQEFAWDAATLTARGNDAVAPLLREAYRKNWEV